MKSDLPDMKAGFRSWDKMSNIATLQSMFCPMFEKNKPSSFRGRRFPGSIWMPRLFLPLFLALYLSCASWPSSSEFTRQIPAIHVYPETGKEIEFLGALDVHAIAVDHGFISFNQTSSSLNSPSLTPLFYEHAIQHTKRSLATPELYQVILDNNIYFK